MGHNVDEIYAGNVMNAAYVKAKPGGSMQLRIVGADVKSFGEEDEEKKQKLVLHFFGEDKMLSLNVTNKNIIRDSWGPDTDAWINKWLKIGTHKVNYQGKMIDGVFVECVMGNPELQAAIAAAPQATGPLGEKAAQSLTDKISNGGMVIEELKNSLKAKHPDAVAMVDGPVSGWTRAWVPEIQAWIAENSLPF